MTSPSLNAGTTTLKRGTDTVATLTVAGLAWAGFVAFKVWAALSGPPLVWQDSLSYEKAAHAGWFSAGLWTGERAPVVPVLLKLTGPGTGFALAQTCFSIVCWTALAIVVSRVVPAGWWRGAAGVAVLALATTQPVRLWDQSVLSETVALSWLALMSTTLLLVVLKPSWLRIAAAALAALGFAATRDTDIVTPLLLGVAFLVSAIARPRPVRWHVLALAGGLLAAAALPLALLLASNRSDVNARDNFVVRVFPYPERVAWFARHGMPEAEGINALAAASRPAPGQVPVVEPDVHDPAFQPLYTWINGHGARTYLEWLATHPGYVVTAPFAKSPETFNNADGQLSYYAGDDTSTEALDRVFAGPWWYAAGVAALALAIALLGGATRERAWQLAALLTAVGAASVLAAWHGDGQEVTRHTVEADVQVRLGLVLAFAIALPGWWRRYRPAKSGYTVRVAQQ